MAGDLVYLDRNDLKEVIKSVIQEVLLSSTNQTVKKEVEYLSRKEAAKLLGVSLPTLHDWTKSGKIPGHRIGTRVRYIKSELENSLHRIKTR